MIGVPIDALAPSTPAGFVGAGLASTLIFPATATALMRTLPDDAPTVDEPIIDQGTDP